MKAILKDKPEAGFNMVDMPVPEIGRKEVLIRMEASALCKSDVDVYDWTPLVAKANYDLPFIMGYEFAGTMEEFVEAVEEFSSYSGRIVFVQDGKVFYIKEETA